MSKKLAIKGHPTRGKEVIKILKMLGGINKWHYWCSDEVVYFIEENDKYITYCGEECIKNTGEYIIYELEEFLEKYPFNVGDKVIDIADGCPGIIDKINWDESVCDMKYYVVFGNGIDFGWYTNDTIKFYQPENSKDIVTTINETQPKRDIYASEFMITHMMLPETPHNVNDELEYKIINGYEFDRVENDKIILKVVKHKYPTTYDKCCDILDANEFVRYELMTNFPKLINARNAYWKIAGEEMGLGKPWKPDWSTEHERKYVIEVYRNNVRTNSQGYSNTILAFPTAEMRDVFYENFKDLIEECKELL